MGILDPIIAFPVSTRCYAEVFFHGETDRGAVDKLIAVLRLYRDGFEDDDEEPERPFEGGRRVAFQTAKSAKSDHAEEIAARQEREMADARAGGYSSITEYRRARIIEKLIESGEPMVRSRLCKDLGIPLGGLTPLFNHPAFKVLENGLVTLSDAAQENVDEQREYEASQESSDDEDDEDDSGVDSEDGFDTSGLDDQGKRLYENIRRRKELERSQGK